MSVGFDITANTQSAKAALKQLQDAFRQLQQEGKKFTEIDLNDIGAGALNDDLKKILENWRRMTQDKGERGKAYRKEGQDKKAPWEVDPRIAYPNATEAQIKQFYQQLLDGLLRGVSGLNPDLPHPSDPTRTPTGESARELERRKRKEQAAENKEQRDQQRAQQRLEREKAKEAAESERRRDLIVGGVGGAMKFTAGMVGIKTGMQAVQAAYQGANDIGRYTDEFMRRTHDVGNGFDFLRDQVIAAGKGLGVASDEAAKLTLAFTRTAHAATIEEARAGTQAAVGLAAGFGMDKEQAVQQMARLSLIGANGSGELSTKDKKFALKIGQTVGQHNLPLEKGLSDFSRLAETAAAHSTKEPATDNLLGYLRSLYDVAHTTRTGLKGEGGMSLLAQADEGVRRADDPATNLMMFQGLSKIMGTENFLKIQRQKEEGAFAPVLNKEGQDSGQTNFSVLLEQMRKQYQHLDPLAVATVLSDRLGLGGIKRGEALIEIEDTYRKQGRGGIGGYEKELADRNIRLDTLNESGIKDIGDILKQADPAERFKIANSKLNTDFAIPLKDEERKRLEGLRNEASGGDPEKQKAFIDAMIQTSAEHGMKATPYSTTEKTLAEIHSALIDTLGKTLTDISGSVSAIAQKYLGETPEQIKAEKEYTTAQQASRAVHEKANAAIDAAQAEVDNAPPGSPERAKAIKKLQKVQESWNPAIETIKKEKNKAWLKKTGIIEQATKKWNWLDPVQENGSRMSENARQSGAPEIIVRPLEWLRETLSREDTPEEERNAERSQTPVQDEIDRLKKKLSRSPTMASGWWGITDQQRDEQRKQFADEAPAIQKQIDILEASQKNKQINNEPEAQKSAAPVRRASGGIIPGGVGGGDRVPALLTPGEFVINASATQKHLPLLHQINQCDGPVRFAQGGLVPGNGSPIGAEQWQDANDATPATVRELQKRLEQLFDPVTRYLAELAANARTPKGHPGKPASVIPGMPGDSGAVAADGTPIAPLADPATPFEETQPQLRAALARGAYPPVTPPTVQQPSPVRRASGGMIPGGVGGGDRVPALLTPGEFVINASATQKHLPLLHQINQGDGPLRFAQGGQVPSNTNNEPPYSRNTVPFITPQEIQRQLIQIQQQLKQITIPKNSENPDNDLPYSSDATPVTVRELQKRLEQLFDPVTRYLAELAAGARALKNQPGKGGTAIPGIGGNGATAADGTPITPIAPATPVEETQPLLRAALARGAYPSVTPSTVHQSTGTVFPGDGRGFLSPGSGTTTARKMREGRPDFVGPPTPDSSAPPSARNAGAVTGTPSAKAAREGSAGGSKANAVTGSRAEFVRKYRPAAEKAAAELGVSADTLLAQSAHETGWGKHMAPGSNNMFGIKADKSWKGNRVGASTREQNPDGSWRRENAGWRAYDSPEDSFSDYAKFLQKNPRYKSALDAGKQGDDTEYMRRLQQAGYTTDQLYAEKVENIKRNLPKADATPKPPSADPQVNADKPPVPPLKADKPPVPPLKADKPPVPPPSVSDNKPVSANIARPINEETHPALRAPDTDASPSARTARSGAAGAANDADGGSAAAGGGEAKPLLDVISKAEGTTDANAQKHGYASGYDVTLGYGKFGGKPGEDKPLSQMTVGEVKQLQKSMLNHPDNNLNSSAVGKYQVVGKTLRRLQSQMGFKDSDVFSPELQDKIGEQLLKGRGLKKFQKGEIGATQFQENIANEWASIPHPGTGRATQHTGVSESEIQSVIAASKNVIPVPPPSTELKADKPPVPPPSTELKADKPPVPPPSTELKADKAPVLPPSADPQVKADKAPVLPPSADPQVKADKAPVLPPSVSDNKPVSAKIARPTNEETYPAFYPAKDARDTPSQKYWEIDKDGKLVQPPADYTPKPLNDSPYTPKPKEPIPEPRTDSASADGAAGGVGHLNITLTQADSRGAKIGHEVNHQMNLRTPRPTGRITVAAANGVA